MNEVYDKYMQTRLLDASLGRRKPRNPVKSSVSHSDIIRCDYDEYKFTVKSSSETDVLYTVDLKTGICNCKVGQTGQACKHQVACSEAFLMKLPQILSYTPENRQWLAGIVLGKENVPPLDFFADLKDCTVMQEKSSGVSSNNNDVSAVSSSTSPLNTVKTEKEDHNITNVPAIHDDHSSNGVIENQLQMQSTSTEIVPKHEFVGDNVKPTKVGLDRLNELSSTLLELLSKYEDDGVCEGLNMFTKKLKGVRTSNQLTSILFSVASSSAVSKGGAGRGKIPCQPTSIARRITGMPRGAAPIGKGRKRAGNLIEKNGKRQRNLFLNVSQNQANAKSHGSGH